MGKNNTAIELQAELQQNEAYQKMLEDKEIKRNVLEKYLAEDEIPLVNNLLLIGLKVISLWDLVNSTKSYKEAIPILIEHLSKPYHPKTKEGIVRALAVKEAKGIACKAIFKEYNNTLKEDYFLRWVFGNTMYIIITEDYINDLINIVKDETNGESRQMFVAALGKLNSSKAKEILDFLVNDKSQIICKESKKALKKMGIAKSG